MGIILQGGLYNSVVRALQLLGLSDVFGTSRVPLYVLNVTYPLVESEITRFCSGKRAVLIVEEGQPDFIEQALNHHARRAKLQATIVGKEVLPMAGEYTGATVLDGVRKFLKEWAPALIAGDDKTGNGAAGPLVELKGAVPARPPGLCTGCPERPLFTAVKLLERDLGPVHISSDIGCHSFSTLPPFNLGSSIMGYGLGPAAASAFGSSTQHRALTIMGDGGFWHNGLSSGITNAVFNNDDGVVVVVGNSYSAATGGQYIPSSRADVSTRTARHTIQNALKGVGVKWVRTVRTYHLATMLKTLRQAMTSPVRGPKVIVAEGECQLNRQRRVRPLIAKTIDEGRRVVKERFGVDAETCTGDHSCVRLSLTHYQTQFRSTPPGPRCIRRQQLCGLRRVWYGSARRDALPFILSGGYHLQSEPMGSYGRRYAPGDHRRHPAPSRPIPRRSGCLRSSVTEPPARPISIAISAMGGQGGAADGRPPRRSVTSITSDMGFMSPPVPGTVVVHEPVRIPTFPLTCRSKNSSISGIQINRLAPLPMFSIARYRTGL